MRDIEEDRGQHEGNTQKGEQGGEHTQNSSDHETNLKEEWNKTWAQKRVHVFLSQARATTVKCPAPAYKLILSKRFCLVSMWLHLSSNVCHATFRTKETKPSCTRGSWVQITQRMMNMENEKGSSHKNSGYNELNIQLSVNVDGQANILKRQTLHRL